MEEKWNEDPSKTVKDALVEKVAVIGENLKSVDLRKLLLQTDVLYLTYTVAVESVLSLRLKQQL